MPSHWKAMPPSSGPIMRVAALVAELSAIAGTMRCGPATSPTMRRRVDISVAHIVPEIRLPSATCHSSRWPVVASVASTVETMAGTSNASMTISLRFTASETAPTKAPRKSCGNWRTATTTVDGERRAGHLVGEQARGQQLEPAHGVGEGADQPQSQEVG